MFYFATEDDLRSGLITDVYFHRTREILKARGIDKYVKMEVYIKGFPEDYEWGVFAGLEEVLTLLEGIKGVSLRASPEGTIFRPGRPVMLLEGKYLSFGIYETSILGIICHSSGVATKAARCRVAAGDRTLISFGGRRVHPVIAPVVERCAYIGGCDGVAMVKSAHLLGIEPTGTMPHTLILIMGDTVEATRAFNEIIHKKIKRVSLIDTFNDEKFEAINVAEALGDNLFAVRLDTPESRRGDMEAILREVRWELDIRGFNNVRLFLSGGLDEDEIRKYCDIVDAFGIGTAISGARVLDFSMDIVEIDGEPVAKRGKMSGEKRLLRCRECHNEEVVSIAQSSKLKAQSSRPKAQSSKLKCPCGGEFEDMLKPVLKDGELLREYPGVAEIREYVMGQLEWMVNGQWSMVNG